MKYGYQTGVAIVLIVLGTIAICSPAKATELTVAHYMAAEEVLKETRTMRQAFGAAGGVIGAYAGGSAAAAAGATPIGIVAGTVAGAIIYGDALYGASTAGTEYAISTVSTDAKRKLNDLGVSLNTWKRSLEGKIRQIY